MSIKKTDPLKEVWAAIKALVKSQKELSDSQKELSDSQKKMSDSQKKMSDSQKKMAKSQKKTDRQLKETSREVKKSLQILSENVKKQGGNFDRKWGSFLEAFVSGDLANLLEPKGIKVDGVLRRLEFKPEEEVIAEYDIVTTGKEMVVIEVKTTLSSNDVNKFVKNFKLFKERFPKYKDNIVYGGIAYLGQAPEKDSATIYANRLGLFLFQAPGGTNNVTIMTNTNNFKRKTSEEIKAPKKSSKIKTKHKR